jgi:iron(III) transport system permease protein
MVLALLGLTLYQRILARSGRFVTVTGKWGPPESFSLGRFRWPLFGAAAVYLTLALVLPYATLGYASLSKAVGGDFSLQNLTLDNFAFIFRDDLSIRGLRNSFLLSIGAAVLASIFAAVIALVEVRHSNYRTVRLLDSVLMLPFGIPSVVIAVGLILAFIRPPLVLYGTIWIIGLAYLIKFLPIAIRTLVAVFEQIDRSLEEASQIVGASPSRTFAHITIPLAWNGIMSAAFLVFIPCFRELGASIILTSPYNETIAFAMMSAWGAVSFEVACAIGVVMLVVTLVVQLVLGRSRQAAFGVAGS